MGAHAAKHAAINEPIKRLVMNTNLQKTRTKYTQTAVSYRNDRCSEQPNHSPIVKLESPFPRRLQTARQAPSNRWPKPTRPESSSTKALTLQAFLLSRTCSRGTPEDLQHIHSNKITIDRLQSRPHINTRTSATSHQANPHTTLHQHVAPNTSAKH